MSTRIWLRAVPSLLLLGGFVTCARAFPSWTSSCPGGLGVKSQRAYQDRNERLLAEIATTTDTQVDQVVHHPNADDDRDDIIIGVSTSARLAVPGGLTPQLFGQGTPGFVARLTEALRATDWEVDALPTAASYPGRDRPGLFIWAITGRRPTTGGRHQWVQVSFDPDSPTGWVAVDHGVDPNRPDCSDGWG